MLLQHLTLILCNIVASVSLIGLNKFLFSTLEFQYPVILTCLHFFATSTLVLYFDSKKHNKKIPLSLIISVAVGRVVSIVAMNLNLKFNSVSTYQLSKIAILPAVAIARRKILTAQETIGALMASIGVFFATVRDPHIEIDGIYIAMIAVGTSTVSILIGERVKAKGFGALEVMQKEMPLSTCLLMLTIPFTEENVMFAFDKMTNSIHVTIVIALTCICAAVINASAFMMITRIGSISYLMCGHTKTLLVLIMGLVLFSRRGSNGDQEEDFTVAFWSLFAFSGVVLYTLKVGNVASTEMTTKKEM